MFQFGPKLNEGKTKVVYAQVDDSTLAALVHKDDITAGDGARHNVLPGKGELSCRTTANCFVLLNRAGLPTHHVAVLAPNVQLVRRCQMVPVELVLRRIATGSFLKRHLEVSEGQTFDPPLVEYFLKDDARHDPLCTPEELTGKGIASRDELSFMAVLGQQVFTALETAWSRLGVRLVDLKVEFGRDATGQLLLADVIDNDSWRLWPHGRKEAMLDKQVYRDLGKVDDAALADLQRRYQQVADLTDSFTGKETVDSLVVIILGSKSDLEHARRITAALGELGVANEVRVASAHKVPAHLLGMLSEYDRSGRRIVYVAVAGRSNALAGIVDGATAAPVLTCPPANTAFAGMDILSSLRMPSGISPAVLLEPEAVALAAAKILAMGDPELAARVKAYKERLAMACLADDGEMRGRR